MLQSIIDILQLHVFSGV